MFEALKPFLAIAKKHLPEVAITTGALLDGAAVIFGIKETPHAMDVLREKKPQTVVEKAGIIIPAYAKTILAFMTGTFLIFMGNKLHLERTAVLMGIAATQKEKLQALAEETKKIAGPKKAQEIEDAVELKKIDKEKIRAQNPIMAGGDTLFVCDWNNYAFYSTVEKIKDMKAAILKEIMFTRTMDVADVDAMIGIPGRSDQGTGWNFEHPPTLDIACWDDGPDGRPMGVLKITPDPDPKWVLNSGDLF